MVVHDRILLLFRICGGGGGSGGQILSMAVDVNLSGATLNASGGRAGNIYGGCGAGGRIKVLYASTSSGVYTTNVIGATTGACNSGTVLLSAAYGASGTTYTGTYISTEPTTSGGAEQAGCL